jgi:ribosomal protein S18 acetylase RimI-like enzyme
MEKEGIVMVQIIRAGPQHVNGISDVCIRANYHTYGTLYDDDYIKEIIETFYTVETISKEITYVNRSWNGWYVAIDESQVVGAICGGIEGDDAEIYALYLDPNRIGEGLGSKLLEQLTQVQKEHGARKQWVSVAKGNTLGIAFYEAKGFQFQFEEPDEGRDCYLSLRFMRQI